MTEYAEQIGTIAERLAAVLPRALSADVDIQDLRRLTAGAGSQTWFFQVRAAGIERDLILRREHRGALFPGALSKTEEAGVIRLAAQGGVCVPEIVLVLTPEDGLGDGFIMEFLQGETLPQRILREERFAVARQRMVGQCGEILARLHAIPATDSVILGPVDSVGQQLARYRDLYRDHGELLPVFELAFRWLDVNQPADPVPALVHGDFRNGNLLVDESGISSVLDWELAHWGDPMEDLGWLCVNAWRFGRRDLPVAGIGKREDLYAAYEQAGGQAVDPERVRYWELFGVVKWGVICLYQAQVHLRGEERSVERAAIGRRVSECELDIMDLLRGN